MQVQHEFLIIVVECVVFMRYSIKLNGFINFTTLV